MILAMKKIPKEIAFYKKGLINRLFFQNQNFVMIFITKVMAMFLMRKVIVKMDLSIKLRKFDAQKMEFS